MLIFLFILALFNLLQGAPITTSSIQGSETVENFLRDTPKNDHFGKREVNNIIVSCVATIFACTWTAIHPNISDPTDSGWDIFKRQVTTMMYALLAPEAITAWAMRQFLAARYIANDYNWMIAKYRFPERSFVERLKFIATRWFHKQPLPPRLKEGEVIPWTITHGFFVQMGGFMLCEDGRAVQTLPYDSVVSLVDHIKRGIVDAPRTTQAEIRDRSKGDVLSKIIVLLQTTWFIAQCIVRWSSSLPVTELEVVTLGFAMLNALTYGLWWNKPQSIGVPVYLERKYPKEEVMAFPATWNGGTRRTDKTISRAQEASGEPTNSPIVADHGKQEVEQMKQRFLTRETKTDSGTGWQLSWRFPYRLIQTVLHPLGKMMSFSGTAIVGDELRVPMFYSFVADNAVVFISSSIIASIFGIIHLIPAFFLDFPSLTERVLWQISAAVITVQPVILGIWTRWSEAHLGIRGSRARSSPLGILALLGVPIYIIARLTIIILAFVSLRRLPSNALVTIDWISFIPHL